MSTMAVLLTLVLGSTPDEGMNRQQLIQLIDTAQAANCRDVSFDYEGHQVNRGESSNEPKSLNYTGTFTRRDDGAILVDLYQFYKPTNSATHAIVKILNGMTEFSSQLADQKQARIVIKKQSVLEYAGPTNYRRIWLADRVKELAESTYLYKYEGIQRIDARECIVARFRLAPDDSTPNDKTVSLIFWIDLGRGGHVLRCEQRFQGESLGELTTVHLAAFPRGAGKQVWLPVSGRVENRMEVKDRKLVFVKEPASYTTYDLLPVTLRLDRGLKDEDFSVKAKRGDLVSDEIRKASYEFGQYMIQTKLVAQRITDTEVKATLDRMLADSAVMANELKASSPLRDGPGWSSYWPWGVTGLASLGAGLLYYRNRTPGRR